MKPSTPILSSRAQDTNAGVNAPQRPAMPSAPALRQFKVLQSGHAPAQLSLFLRPVGAR
jgi:hypothetical protein